MLNKLAKLFGRKNETADTVISVGDILTFESRVHESVGLWYELDYDKDAFNESTLYEYVDPLFEKDPCPGGDEQVVRIYLKAQKKGIFHIIEIENFRGERTERKVHIVEVKR